MGYFSIGSIINMYLYFTPGGNGKNYRSHLHFNAGETWWVMNDS